ncbi:MAG: HNH endonuclease [Chloroflexi bacterium]|nr:HNH endonuclease [Chloroflexota bacterium]
MATAVHLRQDLSKNEKGKILRRWENVTFRIYGMFDKDARTAVGEYVRLAWRIVNKNISVSKILEELSEIGAEFPIDGAVKNMRKRNCYSDWQQQLRYFLFRYEEHLAGEAGQGFNNEQWNRIWEASAADSIEHILPQSSESKCVHWLGNLLMLPPKLNSKLGAKPPKAKAGEYAKTGLLAAQEVVDRLPRWRRRAIEDRETKLLQWALQEWAD